MSDNVVPLFNPELTADEVLDKAKGELTEAVVIGYDANGELDVRSTNMTAGSVAFMCQVFLKRLYNGDYRDE